MGKKFDVKQTSLSNSHGYLSLILRLFFSLLILPLFEFAVFLPVIVIIQTFGFSEVPHVFIDVPAIALAYMSGSMLEKWTVDIKRKGDRYFLVKILLVVLPLAFSWVVLLTVVFSNYPPGFF